MTVAEVGDPQRPASTQRFWTSLRNRGGSFGFGFASQTCSAATNFGLVVLAAHVIGPSGVGIVTVGFAAYLVVLGLVRGLVSNPLVARTAAANPIERVETARFAMSLTAVTTLVASSALAGAGAALPGEIGQGILAFAPWLIPGVLLDLGRSILFRDGRGRDALFADGTSLLTMAAMAPIALAIRSVWSVTACWGAGALMGTAVILVAVRWRPSSLIHSFHWWKSVAWPFGRWMLMAGILYNAASYASVLALSGILGSRQFGGLRAVQSVFAPLTLIGPAIALPGLPLISQAAVDSPRRAFGIACRLAVLATFVTGAYLGVVYALPDVLSFVFGDEFGEFQSIMVPIGIAQLLMAPASALMLLLIGQQRGRTLLWVGTLNACLLTGCSVLLASIFGLTGAAWGAVAGTALGLLVVVIAVRSGTGHPREGTERSVLPEVGDRHRPSAAPWASTE
jgi:O-antigen/teichoic acid export membrane protein